jgi:hypothetical protein
MAAFLGTFTMIVHVPEYSLKIAADSAGMHNRMLP